MPAGPAGSAALRAARSSVSSHAFMETAVLRYNVLGAPQTAAA
jgi:hypothetical protein